MNKSITPKKPVAEDWHPADIVAELHKKGLSLSQLSLDNGYTARNTLGNALVRPYPKAEAIIATALGVTPETLWPSRYQGERRLYRGWARTGIKGVSASATN